MAKRILTGTGADIVSGMKKKHSTFSHISPSGNPPQLHRIPHQIPPRPGLSHQAGALQRADAAADGFRGEAEQGGGA
ncbi:MAG: hypothetical protein MPK75_11420, partial [Alphaproteobacteria bacterium]|nr:hypothetical protein [Alphaproteobacteria bacterium]